MELERGGGWFLSFHLPIPVLDNQHLPCCILQWLDVCVCVLPGYKYLGCLGFFYFLLLFSVGRYSLWIHLLSPSSDPVVKEQQAQTDPNLLPGSMSTAR